MNHADVIVVGAGMAGLTAAGELEKRGISTIVLDKGRNPGGRMATRRVGDATYDHGAQHFSVRSSEFRRQVTRWIDRDLVREWFTSQSNTVAKRPVEARHVGQSGMRRIPEHVASGLRVETSVVVEQIERAASGVVAVGNRGNKWHAAGMIVTPPAPQTIQLLGRSEVRLASQVETMLTGTDYEACLAVMARLDIASGLSDGHLALSRGPIAWMADNQHKGVSAVPAVTIHSSPEFAAANLEIDQESWVAQLVDAARPLFAASVVNASGHRWRYSQPRRTFDVGAVLASSELPLVLAGEVFAGARVEGAFLSGLAAAELMEDTL
jgi:predicted NAD/FAD-dependent oxidoreductase